MVGASPSEASTLAEWVHASALAIGDTSFAQAYLDALLPGRDRWTFELAQAVLAAGVDAIGRGSDRCVLVLVLPLRPARGLVRSHPDPWDWSWRSGRMTSPPSLYIGRRMVLGQWMPEEYRSNLVHDDVTGLKVIYRAYRDDEARRRSWEFARDFAVWYDHEPIQTEWQEPPHALAPNSSRAFPR